MNRLESALAYLELGWSVIPLEPASKKSLIKWKQYQTERADAAQLQKWFTKWPDANIGIITGPVSHIFVVDIDSPEGLELLCQHGELPDTAKVLTSKVGHLYFSYPENQDVKNTTGLVAGVDVRGAGGLVAAPPSVHASGVIYEWVSAPEVIAPAPGWLLELLQAKKQAAPVALPEPQRTHLNGAGDDPQQTRRFIEGCIRSEVGKVLAAPDGEKHTQILKSSRYLAGYIATGAVTSDEIERALFEAIAPRADDKQSALDTIHDGIKYGQQKPLAVPPLNHTKQVFLRGRAARQYIAPSNKAPAEDASAPDAVAPSDDPDEDSLNNGIYALLNGRSVLSVEKEKSDEKGSTGNTQKSFIWDGAACITGEIKDEDGTTIYEVAGITNRNHTFAFEIEATRFADAKALAATLTNFAGAATVFYAGMEKHLGPSIKSFTDWNDLRHGRRFKRVGWTRDGKEFIIPGLEPPDVMMMLSRDLAYRVEPVASTLSPSATNALELLLTSHHSNLTTIALAHALLAPLANICEWRDDKFALFIAGRTGSFKTSWASMLMCLYGDFFNEEKLLKFGMGGTNNALMAYTAAACDVPLLIDNFKPGTGNGQRDAQTLIHGIIEGGEKKRLNRDGTLRDGKEIHCWPVLTGEDVIDDAASIARMVIVAAQWVGSDNPNLTALQERAHLLPQVGGAALQWLMTDTARQIAQGIKPHFYPRRSKWGSYLREKQPDMVNASRVASSLALLECSWEIFCQCPALSGVLSRFTPQLQAALIEAAGGMGNYAAQTHEANRYLSAIRAMLLSNRAYVLDRTQDADKDDRRAFIGWQDDDHVYLQPDAAYREVLEFLRNSGGLNGLGMNTIHRQLEQLGHIAKRGKNHIAELKRVGSESQRQRVLWIERSKIYGDGNDAENEDENDDE